MIFLQSPPKKISSHSYRKSGKAFSIFLEASLGICRLGKLWEGLGKLALGRKVCPQSACSMSSLVALQAHHWLASLFGWDLRLRVTGGHPLMASLIGRPFICHYICNVMIWKRRQWFMQNITLRMHLSYVCCITWGWRGPSCLHLQHGYLLSTFSPSCIGRSCDDLDNHDLAVSQKGYV